MARSDHRKARIFVELLLVGALASVVGCEGGSAPAAAKAEPPPAPVAIATATAGELTDEWVFVGEVRSLRSAELALGAGGEVVVLDVREGDRVEAGELLVEIDKRQASARVSAAVSSRRESERELEQARREAERATKLGATVLSNEEIEQQSVRAETLEARKRRLAAEIRAAKAQLSDYQLVAPFAGVVSARHADLGQWLNPGETVLELVAIDEIEVLVDVRPELAPHVRVGDRVKLRPAGGLSAISQTGEATAEVIGVVPSLDKATRTLKVRISCRGSGDAPEHPPQNASHSGGPPDPTCDSCRGSGDAPEHPPQNASHSGGPPDPTCDPSGRQSGDCRGFGGVSCDPAGVHSAWLLPGAPVDVGFAVRFSTAAQQGGAVIVPRDALVLGAVDTRVIVVVDGVAKPILVDVLATADDQALVSGEGLEAGAVVVTRGNERLRPGQPVRPIDEEGSAT